MVGTAPQSLDQKLDRSLETLRGLRRVAVALSGGVDSALVLRLAVEALGTPNVVAVTGISPSLAEQELADAKAMASRVGVEHLLLETRELDDPSYRANPANRCYFCKINLYTTMTRALAGRDDYALVSGTNADDLGDYRPGLHAAEEHGVRAPLAESGLTKSEIRALCRRFELPVEDKPASPCLSSRVQYGEEITPSKLRMIEEAERVLRVVGLREFRVRHHDKLARIEAPAEWIERLAQPDMRARIDAAFREIGYHYVALDLRGFRSGSMNEVIAFGKKQS